MKEVVNGVFEQTGEWGKDPKFIIPIFIHQGMSKALEITVASLSDLTYLGFESRIGPVYDSWFVRTTPVFSFSKVKV